jgi:hypothetical protein
VGVRIRLAGATAVPVRAMFCVCALSTRVRVPVRLPAAVGVNVTLIVQALCAASEAPQLLDAANSMLEEVRLAIESATSPELVSVIGCEELVVFTCCAVKVSDRMLSVSVAAR